MHINDSVENLYIISVSIGSSADLMAYSLCLEWPIHNLRRLNNCFFIRYIWFQGSEFPAYILQKHWDNKE